MNEHEDFSRMHRKKRHNKSNRLLNIMIGIVVVLILIVGATIIIGGQDKDEQDDKASDEVNTETLTNDSLSNEDSGDIENATDQDDESDGTSEESSSQEDEDDSTDSTVNSDEEQDQEAGSVTIVPNDDAIIEETIVNTAWEPIGTGQSGTHISKYDGESVDWNEKKKAIAYATGVAENDLIYKKIKNGGSSQKSIGIVSTKDNQQKYRVYLEWVDGAGWKPVKMDKLKTLDFDY